jgi:hypothetical protein
MTIRPMVERSRARRDCGTTELTGVRHIRYRPPAGLQKLSTSNANLIEILEHVLDKGVVIDACVRLAFVGISPLTAEARVASIETYLKHARVPWEPCKGDCDKSRHVTDENIPIMSGTTDRVRRHVAGCRGLVR